jgi:Fic family protein
MIHEQGTILLVSEETILKLHRLTRGEIWDAGKYKEKDGDIIEKFPDGRSRVRFKTVSAIDTPACVKELLELHGDAIDEQRIPPLVLLVAFNLDFLCIHPFRDGNGRVSRLLLLLQCYHLGLEVGRYISLERLIEQNKERYYETLEQSSGGWHEGKHDPWPYINYILSIIKMAYREFEQRLVQLQSPKGEKTSLVLQAINETHGPFSVAELQNRYPNVSVDMIRRILKNLRANNQIECLGRGQNALWQKTAKWQLGNVE